SRCMSPSTPSAVTRAAGTAILGTPPRETLICTILALTHEPPSEDWLLEDCTRAIRSAADAANHGLDAGLEYLLAPLVRHERDVRDDPAVGLLGLALLGHRDLHGQGVALEHRRRQAHLTPEVCHPRAVDEAGLHDEPLGEGERERAGRCAPLEDRFARDIFHVHEERLVEAAQVHEGHDVRLRHGPAERAERGADFVLLEGQTVASHGRVLSVAAPTRRRLAPR